MLPFLYIVNDALIRREAEKGFGDEIPKQVLGRRPNVFPNVLPTYSYSAAFRPAQQRKDGLHRG